MNRCLSLPATRLLMTLVIALTGVSAFSPSPASAQTGVREFPKAALRGVLLVTSPPEVQINGVAARLSPGARIKGLTNTLVMSGSLVGTSVLVNYVTDGQGMIHEVWILSTEEAREERAGSKPFTNITFGSRAPKPKTDDGNTPFDQLPRYPQQ